MKRLYTTLLAAAAIIPGMLASSAAPDPALMLKKGVNRVDKLGNSKWDNADGHDIREVNTEGELRVLVLLVEFKDVNFVSQNPKEDIGNLLNQRGYNLEPATGSVADFFAATSCGQFSPKFEIYGPVKLDKTEAEYVTNDETYIDADGNKMNVYAPGRMVEEACTKLDSEINFTDYDANGDGLVDFVYIFHAGKGATTGGNTNTTIWPHAFTLTAAIGGPIDLDGVKVDRYATSCEVRANNKLSGIGLFTHEFSHVLGLPDLYDTANNGSAAAAFTPGPFSLLDAGTYNNDANTVPEYSSYERYALEWMLPVTITGTADITLLPINARNFAYKIPTKSNPKEYYLFEARAKQGWDAYLPGYGLMVWHIDFDEKVWADNKPNNQSSHMRIDLVEADDSQNTTTRDGDLFPGKDAICEFNSETAPMFIDWNRKSTGFNIERIQRHPDGAVSFRVVAEDGSEMPGMQLGSPKVEILENGFTPKIGWNEVPGAESYAVTVYETPDNDLQPVDKYVDGWYFRNTDKTSAEIEGLVYGKNYSVVVYALNANNAARCEKPVTLNLQGSDVPTLSIEYNGDEATLRWTAFAGAVSYELLYGNNVNQTETASVAANFDGGDLPSGWETEKTAFENGKRYVREGQSVKFSTPGSYIVTDAEGDDITSLSFWHRQRFDEAYGIVDIYGITSNGAQVLLETLTQLPDSEGEEFNMEVQPGYKAIKIAYTPLTTGLDYFIDDMKITRGETTFTPLTNGSDFGLDVKENSYKLTDLQKDELYAAKVRTIASTDDVKPYSPILLFRGLGNTSVGQLTQPKVEYTVQGGVVAAAEPFSIFTADGVCIARNVESYTLPQRGIYIILTSNGPAKFAY